LEKTTPLYLKKIGNDNYGLFTSQLLIKNTIIGIYVGVPLLSNNGANKKVYLDA